MPARRNKEPDGVLTVNDVAKLLDVSHPTVRRWLDRGIIKGAFKFPGTRERRVAATDVVEFATEHNYPVTTELTKLAELFNKKYRSI